MVVSTQNVLYGDSQGFVDATVFSRKVFYLNYM